MSKSSELMKKAKAADASSADTVKAEVLTAIATQEITADEGGVVLSVLEEKTKKNGGNLYCKVSEKGGCSLYGLQRMPVTLYVEQWERLFDFGDKVREFMAEHANEFKRKGDTAAA